MNMLLCVFTSSDNTQETQCARKVSYIEPLRIINIKIAAAAIVFLEQLKQPILIQEKPNLSPLYLFSYRGNPRKQTMLKDVQSFIWTWTWKASAQHTYNIRQNKFEKSCFPSQYSVYLMPCKLKYYFRSTKYNNKSVKELNWFDVAIIYLTTS